MRTPGIRLHKLALFGWAVVITAVLLLLSLPVLAGGRILSIILLLVMALLLCFFILHTNSIITSYISLLPSFLNLSSVSLSWVNWFIINIKPKYPMLALWLENGVIFFIRQKLGLKIISSAIIKHFITLIYFISPILASFVSAWLLLIIVSLFFLSKEKKSFFFTLIFLFSFWGLVGFAGLDELYNGYLLGKSNNGSNPPSPGEGSSGQVGGGSTPPGGGPPGGPDPHSVNAALAGQQANKSGDWKPDSKHTIDWDVGSAADSDEFVWHDKESNTIHTGEEKEGFMSRNARDAYQIIKSRVESMSKAKSDPLHSPEQTELRPGANVVNSKTKPSFQISKEGLEAFCKHMEKESEIPPSKAAMDSFYKEMAKPPGSVPDESSVKHMAEMKNWLKDKPETLYVFKTADKVDEIDGLPLKGQAKVEREGALLYKDKSGWHSFTNKHMESKWVKVWEKGR